MRFWRPRFSNCLIWAGVMRLRHRGSRMLFVGSIYGWWPHVIWLYDGRLFEYAPPKHVYGRISKAILFSGQVREVESETILRCTRNNDTRDFIVIRRLDELRDRKK